MVVVLVAVVVVVVRMCWLKSSKLVWFLYLFFTMMTITLLVLRCVYMTVVSQ